MTLSLSVLRVTFTIEKNKKMKVGVLKKNTLTGLCQCGVVPAMTGGQQLVVHWSPKRKLWKKRKKISGLCLCARRGVTKNGKSVH